MRFFFLVPFLISLSVFSQAPVKPGARNGGGPPAIGRIYGKIQDAVSGESVGYASVVAVRVRPKGDTILNGALTEENGDFNLTGLPVGPPITLRISYLGFEDFSKTIRLSFPDNIEMDAGNFKIKPVDVNLDQVEITAEKSQVQMHLDKRVFRVDKNIVTTGGTAEDVMRNVPSVTVNADGGVQLRNSSPIIYVDGRPTVFSLNQIPADQIESVEVITNPSSRFEAAASGGILNIVLKKNRKPGFNGFLGLGIGTQDRYNGSLNLNLKTRKFNWTAFGNFNRTNNPTEGFSRRRVIPGDDNSLVFSQNTNTTFGNRFDMGRVGLEYTIDNRNSLSLNGTINAGAFNIASDQVFSSKLDTSVASGTRIIRPKNDFVRNNAQILWKRTYPRKGKEMTFDITYGFGNGSNAGTWVTTGQTASGRTSPNFPELVLLDGANIGSQITAQFDRTEPINDSSKFEYGARIFWDGRKQQYFFNESFGGGAYLLNNSLSIDANVNEAVNAAYVNYSSRIYGIGYQAGLRFETSELIGRSNLDQGVDFGYVYPGSEINNFWKSFFPSLYLTKSLKPGNDIQFNISRKINRPNYMQIMPVVQNNDRQNVRIGNPGLAPEFINLMEINYNRIFSSHNWLIGLYGRQEENPIVNVGRPSVGNPDLIILRPENGVSSFRYGLDNTLRLQFGKSLDITTNVNVFNILIKTLQESNEGWAVNSRVTTNYKFPGKWKNLSLQFSPGYESNRIIPQGVRLGYFDMDAALKYSFMGFASLTFQAVDITNVRRDQSIINLGSFEQETMRRRDLRHFKINLQVPFGKFDSSIMRRAREGRKSSGGGNQDDFGG
jgi:hypothetical protein